MSRTVLVEPFLLGGNTVTCNNQCNYCGKPCSLHLDLYAPKLCDLCQAQELAYTPIPQVNSDILLNGQVMTQCAICEAPCVQQFIEGIGIESFCISCQSQADGYWSTKHESVSSKQYE